MNSPTDDFEEIARSLFEEADSADIERWLSATDAPVAGGKPALGTAPNRAVRELLERRLRISPGAPS